MKNNIAWIIGAAILIMCLPLQAADVTVAPFKAPTSSGADKPSNAPDLREGTFDGIGKVDRITSKEVVISDQLFRLTGATVYRRENGSVAAFSDFTVGTVVWYVLDSNGSVKSLWKKGG